MRIDMEVEDNGEGIPSHLLSRLFMPFSEGFPRSPIPYISSSCHFADLFVSIFVKNVHQLPQAH